MRTCLTALALGIALLAGCSGSKDIPKHTSLIPDGRLRLAPHYAVAYADLVAIGAVAAAVYVVSDPTAPTWKMTETHLPDHRYRFELRKQYLSVGGDGEARQVIARRLAALAEEAGLGRYRIDRYEESVDNRILLPSRQVYAEATLLPVY